MKERVSIFASHGGGEGGEAVIETRSVLGNTCGWSGETLPGLCSRR